MRQDRTEEAYFNARSNIATLAQASSEAAGSVAAFYPPRQAELVCRELSGCF